MQIDIDLTTMSVDALGAIGDSLADVVNTSTGDARKHAAVKVAAVLIELESRDADAARTVNALVGAAPAIGNSARRPS